MRGSEPVQITNEEIAEAIATSSEWLTKGDFTPRQIFKVRRRYVRIMLAGGMKMPEIASTLKVPYKAVRRIVQNDRVLEMA